MKKTVKTMSIAACAMVLLSGCSMWNGDDTDSTNNSTANKSDVTQPQNERSMSSEESIQNMLNYMRGQGVELSEVTPIDNMDFAAHEGQSFSYNGNTGYLYRLRSDDENMKALLSSAKTNGTVKVNMDGTEREYNAYVNGDYLFVYDKAADMGNFVNAMGNYVPGATTTTPNQGANGKNNNPVDPTKDTNENNDAGDQKTSAPNTNEPKDTLDNADKQPVNENED